MKEEYILRIRNNVEDPEHQCKKYVDLMQKEFPELKKVRGWYFSGRDIPHWWCIDENNNIIDPTIDQFDDKNGVYLPIDEETFSEPVGKCLNCGELYYDNKLNNFCSGCCEREFLNSLLL